MNDFENNQEVKAESPKKKKKKSGPFFWILICICAGAAIFSGYKLVGIILDYRVGRTTYQEVEKKVIIPSVSPSGNNENGDEPESKFMEIDFAALKEINPEAIGWIYCPGTKINYPIMYHEYNNDKYLRMTPYYQYYIGGSIFMDYRNRPDFSDRNTIIYGHQMDDGTMFEALRSYNSQKFFNEHPFIYITLESGKYIMEIFSAYVTEATSDAYIREFKSDEEYLIWLNQVSVQTYVNTGVRPTTEDNIVTLSTCTYDFENARFVVHGRLVKVDTD